MLIAHGAVDVHILLNILSIYTWKVYKSVHEVEKGKYWWGLQEGLQGNGVNETLYTCMEFQTSTN